jgi:hypothetical protein
MDGSYLNREKIGQESKAKQARLNSIIEEEIGDHILFTVTCMLFEMALTLPALLGANLKLQ